MIEFVMFVAAMINGLIKGKSITGNNISLILALIEIPEIKFETNIRVKFINNVDKNHILQELFINFKNA